MPGPAMPNPPGGGNGIMPPFGINGAPPGGGGGIGMPGGINGNPPSGPWAFGMGNGNGGMPFANATFSSVSPRTYRQDQKREENARTRRQHARKHVWWRRQAHTAKPAKPARPVWPTSLELRRRAAKLLWPRPGKAVAAAAKVGERARRWREHGVGVGLALGGVGGCDAVDDTLGFFVANF